MLDSVRTYLEKRATLSARPLAAADLDDLDVVIAIPALAEKDSLFQTLGFLERNPPDQLARTLVICVVNNRHMALADEARNNRETLAILDDRVKAGGPLRLACIDAASPGNELPDKTGVGLARKIGLDWGLAVLADTAGDRGILVCLDADTRVEPGYLAAVRRHFSNPGAWAAVIEYAHDEGETPAQTAAILCYEIFLRYHVAGLCYAGSPYAFPTIGSTIACTTGAYVAVAGMNQRQAGEDFYFLQQLAKTGPVRRIAETVVHPSPRPSPRVPFGTGQRVRRFLGGGQDEYRLYDPRSYQVLKVWLDAVAQGLDQPPDALLSQARALCPALCDFLEGARFTNVWPRLQENARGRERLLAQFHRWFDGFKTIKLMHFLRDNAFPEVEMFGAVRQLLEWSGRRLPEVDWNDLRHNPQAQRSLLDQLRFPRD